MIAKEFETFLMSHLDNYLIPEQDLAIFIDTHNADHVMLLLVSNGFSRVPVITREKKYVGTISISDIMMYQSKRQLTDWEMSQTDIGEMVNTKIETISITSSLTEIMHKLIDYPFLPVVDRANRFVGIITRKSILKAVNSLLHDFTDDYTIIKKMKSYIEPFIASKALSQNSQKAYRYDLQQFCQLVGERVNQDKLLLYQNSIANLSLSAKKRKLSTANQFLYYLYQIKYLNSYFRLTDTMKVMRTEKQQAAIINTDIFYQKTPFVWGQLISLLILELGLTPSEVAGIEVANLDLNFQMLTLKTKKGVRVLPLSQILIPFLEQQLIGKEVYLFEHRGIPFSRQWFFNHLKTFVRSIGYEGLTAQKLREQFILKEKLAGKSIIELSDILGLKSPVTLEKYYKS